MLTPPPPHCPSFHFSQYTDILHSFNQSTESDIPPFSEKSGQISTELVFAFEQTSQAIRLTYCAEHSWTDGCWAWHCLTSLKLSDLLLLPATLIWLNTRTFSSIKWCLNQDIQIWYEVVNKKNKKRQIWALPTCKTETDSIKTKHIFALCNMSFFQRLIIERNDFTFKSSIK